MRSDDQWLFPPFRLDLRSERLWREGEEIPLRPKLFALLRYLVEHPGRVVTREELRQAVWPGMIVSKGVLRVCLGQLREALEDKAEEPHFIETLAGRGYRFIAPLTTVPRPVPSSKLQVPSSTSVSSQSAIVGREAELARLHKALEKALRGERQVVFVTGEPGIGKTTVVDAFLQHAQAVGECWIGQGQCVEQYGAGEAYLPVLEAFGRIGRTASGEQFITLLHQHAPTWLVQMPALLGAGELEALQRKVAGATKERMLREMVEAVEVISAERPLILWLEDLHWADYSTFDWLAAVGQRRSPARLLILVTYRPAEVSLSGHPLKGVKQELQAHGQGEEVWLRFLTPDEVTQYLALRYPHHQFPPELAHIIHRRTDGNPLFIVNLVEYLGAQGMLTQIKGRWQVQTSVQEIASGVPENLRQVIERHIEQLSEDQQGMLEVASVAGTEFSATAVAAGLDTTVDQVESWCEGLVRRGHFLRASGSEVLPDGMMAGRYGFLHALYQAVLYDRLPLTRRTRLHRRVGESEERLYGDRAGEIAAELAVHFEQGQNYARAIPYLQQAGEKALQRSANAEAITHSTKGLALLQTLPDTPERAQSELRLQVGLSLALVMTKGYAAVEVERVCTRTRELCRQMEETPEVYAALYQLCQFYTVRGDLHTAREVSGELLQIARRQQSPMLVASAHAALALVLYALGDLSLAQDHAEQGLALYERQLHGSFSAFYGENPGRLCLLVQAWCLQMCGYPDQAQASIQESLAVAQEIALPFELSATLTAAGDFYMLRRARQAVQEAAEAAIALAKKEGFPHWIAHGTVLQGWALAEQGQTEAGIAQIRQSLSALQAMGAGLWRPRYLGLLAAAYGKAGQTDEGVAVLAEALELAHRTDERQYEAELYRLKGELALQSQTSSTQVQGKSKRVPDKSKSRRAKASDPPSLTSIPQAETEAEACFQQAIEIARRQDAKSLELRAVMSLTRLWRRQGKKKQAHKLLADIYGWFTEGFDTKDLQEAQTLLKELA